jgi:hypothetical protein
VYTPLNPVVRHPSEHFAARKNCFTNISVLNFYFKTCLDHYKLIYLKVNFNYFMSLVPYFSGTVGVPKFCLLRKVRRSTGHCFRVLRTEHRVSLAHSFTGTYRLND